MRKIIGIMLVLAICFLCGCSQEEVLINDMPEWSGKLFTYHDTTCDSLDLFVDWIKSGGTLEVDNKDYLSYGYMDKFIQWVKDEDEILLPKSAHEDFKFSYVKVSPKSASFTVGFFTEGENCKQFDVIVTGGLRKNLETLIGRQKDNYIKGMPHSRWGEYYYTDYYKVGFSSVRFFYEEYAITLTVYGADKEKPWNPEYLDYFDFEKVTLK